MGPELFQGCHFTRPCPRGLQREGDERAAASSGCEAILRGYSSERMSQLWYSCIAQDSDS